MKRTIQLLALICVWSAQLKSQCVPTCSNYVVAPIDFTTFPSGSTNVTPSFTNPFLGISADDGSIGPIPIGFSFNYYCNTYTDVHICSNGFIMLDYQPFPWPVQYVHPTQNIPSTTLPDGMVAFNMTDLDPGQGGTITYTTVGMAPNRRFVVTFSNVPCFSTPADLNTGQIVFYETTNIIEIHTTKARPDINQSTLGSMQGIENTTGTSGVTPPGRNANNTWGVTADSTAYRFLPYTPTPPTALSGNTLLCQGALGAYQINPIVGAQSYTWSMPAGWNGSSTTTVLNATAGVSGNLSVSATYTCGTSLPAILSVSTVPAPIVSIQSASPTVLCSGNNITFNTSGAVSYTIEPGSISGTSPLVFPVNASAVFSVTGENSSGCVSLNTATINVLAYPTPSVSVSGGSVCLGESFTINPSGADSYIISGGFAIVTPTLGQNNYSVTGTSTNGCVSSPVICQVNAIALPTVNVASSRPVMCAGESVTLTASGASTYTWNTNATGPSLVVNPTSTKNYTVIGELNSCKHQKTFTQIVNACVGVEEKNSLEFQTMLFPNPVANLLNVSLSSAEATEVSIYNTMHQLVKTIQFNDTGSSIDLNELADGLYMVHIQRGVSQCTKKIVIRRN